MRTRTCPRFCIDAKGQLIYETCIDRHARIQRVEGIERELREKRRGKKKRKKRKNWKRKIDLASVRKNSKNQR